MSNLDTKLEKIKCSYCKRKMIIEKKYYRKICCDDCKRIIKTEGLKKIPPKNPKQVIATCICGKPFKQFNPLIRCLNNHAIIDKNELRTESDQILFPRNFFSYCKTKYIDPNDRIDEEKSNRDMWIHFKWKWKYWIELEQSMESLHWELQIWASINCKLIILNGNGYKK